MFVIVSVRARDRSTGSCSGQLNLVTLFNIPMIDHLPSFLALRPDAEEAVKVYWLGGAGVLVISFNVFPPLIPCSATV